MEYCRGDRILKQRFPSQPPQRRVVAPDMDKPKLEGESNADFLLRCYAEDPRFNCSTGNPCKIRGVPPLSQIHRERNEMRRKAPWKFNY